MDVKKGHDDILFGAMLSNIAMRQWAPPRVMNHAKSKNDEEVDEVRAKMEARGGEVLDDASLSLINHHEKIMRKVTRYPQEEEFDEVGVS